MDQHGVRLGINQRIQSSPDRLLACGATENRLPERRI